MGYEWIYKLKPIRETEGGWWKLKWKPIKMGTYNIYITSCSKSWHSKMIGIRFYETNAHNGWHRYWDGLVLEIGFCFFIINFWIRWNIIVHKDGPSDITPTKPLNIKQENND